MSNSQLPSSYLISCSVGSLPGGAPRAAELGLGRDKRDDEDGASFVFFFFDPRRPAGQDRRRSE